MMPSQSSSRPLQLSTVGGFATKKQGKRTMGPSSGTVGEGFVYVGNRLHDSIGILSVGPTGELKYVGEEWTRGNYPRSFTFDPTGAFLYCCNQRGDIVAVFRVDRKSGGLTFTCHYTPVGNPSHIVFLDLKKEG